MSYSIKHSGIKGMSWGKKKYVRKYKAGTSDPEGELKPGETRTGNVDGWIYVYKTESESKEEKAEGLIDDVKGVVDDIIDKGSEIFSNIAEWVKDLFDDSDKDAAKLARQALRDDRDKIYEQTGEKDKLIQKNYEENMENQFGSKRAVSYKDNDYAYMLAEQNKHTVINDLSSGEVWRHNNCVGCSVAADLTKRGYDVEALASEGGMTERDIEKLYKTNGRKFAHYTVDGAERDLSKEWNRNTSGIYVFEWAAPNGQTGKHSVFYSVDNNGDVGLYDAQLGEYTHMNKYLLAERPEITYDEAFDHIKTFEIKRVSVLRTDDLDFDIKNVSKIVRSSSAAKSKNSGILTTYYTRPYVSGRYITKEDDTNWTLDRKPTAAEREEETSKRLKEMKRKR